MTPALRESFRARLGPRRRWDSRPIRVLYRGVPSPEPVGIGEVVQRAFAKAFVEQRYWEMRRRREGK